ncbi:MAG TPA: insulinase family protein [Dysgonamonadaceae bacterium]|nr:insulinase family protein [Dysgonamonadaceae bacterium]
MKKLVIISTLLLCSLFVLFSKNPLSVKEYRLSNGLTVWLNEDNSQPKVIGSIIVKAGAKDSPNTGVAHYFEHILFKGTDKIGTINYTEEKVWLDSISEKYDELALLTDPKERLEIQKEINELSIKAAEYVIPNEFNKLVSQYGGTGLNAGTSWDYTMYFNTFTPQYMKQWCEINSERLINPVFRMFQSELETVYEEKNMYADMLGSQAAEKIIEEFFKPHPYQYPIIGSTENLKNPRLSEMEEFFKTYYIAGNMGLVMSGDFDTEEVLPLLDATFGKIQKGSVEKAAFEMPAPIKGKVDLKAKIPIPFVRANALLWRGVPSNHPDEVALSLAISFLSNENKTGLLDKLTIDGKLMMSTALPLSMNDAGAIAIIAIPNIPFQTYGSAQKLLFGALNKIKNGDISDEMFQSLKLEQERKHLLDLESLDTRNQKIIEVFAKGMTWNEYLKQTETIKLITKQDVIDIANKYFSNNYFDVKKKTGKYSNAKISKPPFKPIEAVNKEEESDYSKWLKTLDSSEFTPRYLDFENDGLSVSLDDNSLLQLYHTFNSMNNVFNLTMNFEIGSRQLPTLTPLVSYLNYLGTDKQNVDEFNQELQQLGSTLSFNVNATNFTISVSGFDNAFEETFKLATHFLTNLKPDKSKLKKLTKEKKIEDKATRKSSDELSKALTEKVKFGNASDYLTRLSLKELKQVSAEELISDLQKILSTEGNFHYIGTLSQPEVATIVTQNFPVNGINSESNNPDFKEGIIYSQPKVFFYNDSKATQSIVQAYILGPVQINNHKKNISKLFNSYFGGGMSSLMFQEIREFRSLAYRANSSLENPPVKLKDKAIRFNLLLSTQADKTTEAIQAVESLLVEMPFNEKRLKAAKENLINQAQSAYPNFREKTQRIAFYKQQGYSDDPNKLLVEDVSEFNLQNLEDFYTNNIQGKTVVYIVVGNKKKIDIKQLEQIGELEEMKVGDFLK